MTVSIAATSVNGVLKPEQPLPLLEHAKVRVTVRTAADWVQRTAGMIKWTGDAETLQRLTEDVEFDPQEGS